VCTVRISEVFSDATDPCAVQRAIVTIAYWTGVSSQTQHTGDARSEVGQLAVA